MVEIICYTGGTCGDLIVSLIDSNDVQLINNAVVHNVERARLKKPHLFKDDHDKDLFIKNISKKYLSIPSHDLNYHLNRNHNFIGITVEDFKTALWAANRFKDLHRSHVWQEMTESCGAKTINDYAQILIDFSKLVSQHTNRIIRLEDIINGNVITKLEDLGFVNCDQSFYNNWLRHNIK